MPKNIIISCDGTGNQFNEENSNVIKLHQIIKKDRSQVCYYDPGVGTISEKGLSSSVRKKISIAMGLGFGVGLKKNVEEAYRFLMDMYEEGDTIFLFGFSRGAYTVRILAALIHKCGLLYKGNQNLFEYAYKIFENDRFELSNKFRIEYSRAVNIHFLGVWDTVSSYGWIGNLRKFPFTANNPSIDSIRHAVAIDEMRTYYRQNLFGPYNNDLLEVWFAGAHSDVGGSYKESESGLAKIALNWMIIEARQKGLLISKSKYNSVVFGEGKEAEKPNPFGMLHKSLKGAWWLLEIFPRRIYHWGKKRKVWKFPFGRPRTIRENSKIHISVTQRLEKDGIGYKPQNVPPLDQLTIIQDGQLGN